MKWKLNFRCPTDCSGVSDLVAKLAKHYHGEAIAVIPDKFGNVPMMYSHYCDFETVQEAAQCSADIVKIVNGREDMHDKKFEVRISGEGYCDKGTKNQ